MAFTLNRTAPARFWAKVRKAPGDACYEWTGHRNRDGYGTFRPDGANTSSVPAHRVAWVLAGDELTDDMLICHTCDNPPCVRRSHLFDGTPADNTADMMAKGRHRAGNTVATAARGSRHGSRTKPERLARGDRNGSRTHPDRLVRGEANPRSRTNAADVAAMREAWAGGNGESQASLAERYGISHRTVSPIVRRITWRHVP